MDGGKLSLICLVLIVSVLSTRSQELENPCRRGLLPCDCPSQCIERKQWCDDVVDCNDGSDEKYCQTGGSFDQETFPKIVFGPSHKCNPKIHFTCRNKQCVPAVARCDGYGDCADNSDEWNCEKDWEEETTTTAVPCPTVTTTRPPPPKKPSQPKWPPESSSAAPVSETPKNYCGQKLPCDCPHQCIERGQWCDGIVHCNDRSDEKYCETDGWSRHNCNPQIHFTCHNKQCVPAVAKCDGYGDCKDHSDEWNCEKDSEEETTTTAVPCPTVTTTRPPPITEPSQPECPHESTAAAPIPEKPKNHCGQKLPCDCPRQCIERGQWCDGIVHCNDRSDEKYCKTDGWSRHNCNSQIHFTCHNKQCVPAVAKCDGYRDCKDHSDEWNCYSEPIPRPPCPTVNISEPHVNPVWPEVLRPNVPIYTVYHHPGNCPTSNTKKTRLPRLSPFEFERNPYSEPYRDSVETAVEWLIGQRDFSYGWGKDTPRALVALSLASNSFDSTLDKNDLMRRRLRLDLGAQLIKKLKRTNRDVMSDTRLAMYINALMATCQDPRDVFGQNLAEQLHRRTQYRKSRRATLYPFVYITLCLVDISIDQDDLSFLASLIHANISDEVSKDRFILAASALACFRKTKNWDRYKTEIDHLLDTALYHLQHKLQLNDGSFGSVYSTALAAQALHAIDSNHWNLESLYDYLLDNQSADGSFGDLLATYYALPALAGRSLVHLRNTKCHEPVPVEEPPSPCEEVCSLTGQSGIQKTVRFSLVMGYPQRSAVAISMTVPEEFSFFDIMRIAQCTDKRFRFLHTENPTRAEVYAIADIANDPERDRRWHLYVLDSTTKTLDTSEIYLGDIRELIPKDSQELLFWYFKDHQTSAESSIIEPQRRMENSF